LIKYEIDEDTKELLTETLGLAQRVIDLQYDDEMADLLQDMLEDLSERFDIKVKEVKVTVDDDGTITAKIVDEPTQSLPDTRTGLSLVSDNGNKKVVQFKKKTDLPPGFSLTPSDDPDT
jgi:hypothetical protein